MSPLRMLKLAALSAVAVLTGTIVAHASDATLLGDRAGFLLGHGHRCGIQDGRLRRLGNVIDIAIATFAVDDGDKQEAASRFTVRFLAGALAQARQDPLPSCTLVRSELLRLEQHRTANVQSQTHGDDAMARETRPRPASNSPRPKAAGPREKISKKTTTTREDLTAAQRDELELKLSAAKVRGRAPSI